MTISRRAFLTTSAATAIAPALSAVAGTVGFPGVFQDSKSLIPRKLSAAPNYWCTWAVQNYMYGQNFAGLDPSVLEGDSGASLARTAMTEQNVLSHDGWANSLYPSVRGELYLLLDDGWETGGTATFDLDSAKFPSFAGNPSKRLQELNNSIQKRGWRGAALWCRNTPEDARMRKLEELSETAEIRYWKIDIGDPLFGLIRVRNQSHIPLTLEHVHGESAVNGDWKVNGRFGSQPWGSRRMTILSNTDVYRTYDVTSILSFPTTLDRLSSILKGAEGHSEIRGLLNVEDEVYLAATMGCTMGVMRHPFTGKRPGIDADLFFNGPRQTKRRIDEVVRAVRWQRIAAPFPPGHGTVSIDEEVLTDSWSFERAQTWQQDLIGSTVYQGAPARISRNLPLPEVRAAEEKPFVFAARFPNGAVAVAAQERTRVAKAWYMPASDVTLRVHDAPGPFGIFGGFGSLTMVFDRTIKGKRIFAQDLAGEKALDITSKVQVQDKSLRLSGEIIRWVGLLNATPDDLSSPGMILAVS